MNAKKIKDWLKLHGHKAERVNAVKLDTEADLRAAVCLVHGLSVAEYTALITPARAR